MAYIDLLDGFRNLGRASVPAQLTGAAGQQFDVKTAAYPGGNGVVFNALRRTASGGVDRTCAIKMLRRQDAARIDRFRNEARVLKESGRHPRIVPYHDHGETTLQTGAATYTVPWIAMDLAGTNIRAQVTGVGPLAPAVAVKVAGQLCSALGHLHAKGFIHRDVKPANVVWQDQPDGDALLIDLGIAKRVGEDVSGRPLDNFTRQGEFVGPVFFSSPEQIAYAEDATHPVDHRSDLFQLGKVLWFMATGKISAGIPARADCPMGGKVRALVMDLIADCPDDRPSDAKTVGARLSELGGAS